MTLIPTPDEQIEAYEGEWQDFRCQEERSSEGKLSPLCNACKQIFTASEAWLSLKYNGTPRRFRLSDPCKHIRDMEVLRSSATRGCRLCHLLLTYIEQDSQTEYRKPAGEISYRLDTSQKGRDLNIDFAYSYSVNESSTRERRIGEVSFGLEPQAGQWNRAHVRSG